jgi:ABC-2 type transport system ATP-binding protein
MRRSDPHTTPVVVENVVKRYASVTAVDGVSFAIERGEVFALLGPNGAARVQPGRFRGGDERQRAAHLRALRV